MTAPTHPDPRPDDEGRETLTGRVSAMELRDHGVLVTLTVNRAGTVPFWAFPIGQPAALTPHPAPLGATDEPTEELLHSDVCEVLCRVFEDGADEGMEEWRAWYEPIQWLHGYRALGAFIRHRLDRRASAGATDEGLRAAAQLVIDTWSAEPPRVDAFTAALTALRAALQAEADR